MLGDAIGRGGTAEVYRALDERLGVPVAVKILRGGLGPEVRRMVQEAAVQASLKHPNIVAVTDCLDLGGRPAVVMELVEGVPLDQLLQAGALSMHEVQDLFRGIVEGVRAAHQRGLVHRDLKPANVLVMHAGHRLHPKVADFGLAKQVGDAQGHTRTGAIMGTPRYMSPEQIRDSKDVDTRTDLFALGAILYEMVTGQPAFDNPDTLLLFNQIASGEHRAIPADTPPHLTQIIERCLEPDRDARLQSTQEVLELLGEAGAMTWRPEALQRAVSADTLPSMGLDSLSSETWTESEGPEAEPVGRTEAPPSGSLADLSGSAPAPVATTRSWVPYAALGAVLAVALSGAAVWMTPQVRPGFTGEQTPRIHDDLGVQQLFEQAVIELDACELPRAMRHLEEAIARGATDPAVFLLAATTALIRGDVDTFDQHVANAVPHTARVRGPVPELVQALAAHQGEVDELEWLEPVLLKHLEAYPTDRVARILHASAQGLAGEVDVEVVRRLAQDRPHAALGWVMWVDVLRGVDLDQAQQVAEQARTQVPNSAPLLAEVAITRLMLSDFEGGLQAANQALRLDPSWWPARLHGATAAVNLGDREAFERLVAPMRGEQMPVDDRRVFSAWVSRALGNVGQLAQSEEWARHAAEAAVHTDHQQTLLRTYTYQVEVALQRWMASDDELRRRTTRLDAAAADPSVPAALRREAGEMSVVAHAVLAARQGDDVAVQRAKRRVTADRQAQLDAEALAYRKDFEALRAVSQCDARVVAATTLWDAGQSSAAVVQANGALEVCPGTSNLPPGLATAVVELGGGALRLRDRWPHADASLPVMQRLMGL